MVYIGWRCWKKKKEGKKQTRGGNNRRKRPRESNGGRDSRGGNIGMTRVDHGYAPNSSVNYNERRNEEYPLNAPDSRGEPHVKEVEAEKDQWEGWTGF